MTASSPITVTGVTGHIGGRIADILLAEGRSVRAVGRDAARLKPLATRGAEAFIGDMSDPAAAERAFTGAQAVFAMIPPNIAATDVRADQNRFADSYVRAIQRSKVSHVVALSSIGAHQGTGMGPVNGLHDWEEKLKGLYGVNVLILRPAYFMENLLVNAGMIKNNRMMGSALRADLRFSPIATADIAAVAASALDKRGFSGISVRELHGQRDLSMEEVRGAIAGAVNMPDLTYVQFPYADAEKAMVGMGLSADYAALLMEMSRSMNEGKMKATQPRSAQSTTPLSIEEFARAFVGAVNG